MDSNEFGCSLPPPNLSKGVGEPANPHENIDVSKNENRENGMNAVNQSKNSIESVLVYVSDEESEIIRENEHTNLRKIFLEKRKKFHEEREADRQNLLLELGKVTFDAIQNMDYAGAKSQLKIEAIQGRLIPLRENYENEKKKLDFYYTLQTPTKHHLKAAAIQSAAVTTAGANLSLEQKKVEIEVNAELQRNSNETTRFWAIQRMPIQQLCKDFFDRWTVRGNAELMPLAKQMNRSKHKNIEEILPETQAGASSEKRVRSESPNSAKSADKEVGKDKDTPLTEI